MPRRPRRRRARCRRPSARRTRSRARCRPSRKVADALLDALALVGERELRAAVREHLRDRPCDRALVRDAEDERRACPRMLRPSRAILRYPPLPCAAPSRSSPAARRSSAPRLRRHGSRPSHTRRPRVRAAMLPAHHGRRRRASGSIVGSRAPPLAARGGRGLSAHRARAAARRAHAARRAPTCACSRAQQARAAAQIRRAIPQARVGRRFQIVLDALTVSLPVAKLPALVASSSVAKVYPSVAYTLALDHSPSVIGADVLRQHVGRRRHRHQDRGRRRRHRPVEPVLRSGGLLVPAGLPARRHEVDDAEGDRRARLPRPERRGAGTARRRPRLLVPRHARRRHRRRRLRDDRARRAPTIRPSRA